ncbi:COG3178: Predicted phosphotransferase related to Ser/Thr protein kinases [hydrothermal vent metagenome]|uniref:COG3178: Predicted phosphotransferase related to Ser/Thr protein kinases n=1 Tax=hydrothermal vent metagenome TaxID=652676 RepID=A0A3B1C587_9ZZZZ
MIEASVKKEISGLLDKTFPDTKFDEPVMLDGDASTRVYFRVKGDDQNSIIIMLADDKSGIEAFSQTTALFKQLGADTPSIYGVNGRASAIEDLTDTLLQDYIKTVSEEALVYEYQRIVDDLISFQGATLRCKDRKLPCFNLAFDKEKLTQEIEFANDYFLYKYLGAEPKQSEMAIMRDRWEMITARLAEETPTLTHRDFHSRNIMVKDKRRVWIDYQDARMGRLQYDLASLLFDPYVNLPEKAGSRLVDYYYSKLPEIIDKPPGYDQFMEIYVLSAVQRLYKALGTFGYQTAVRGVDTYVKYIPIAVNSLLRLLRSRPDLKPLAQSLSPYLASIRK